MKPPITFILLLALLTFSVSAQVLPKGLTEEERASLPAYLDMMQSTSRSAATPPMDPRAPAEWEEMQGVGITWTPSFREILAQIVEHAQDDVTVYIHTRTDELLSAQNYLNSQGIDLNNNVEFIEAANNSIWIRDYGANAVYVNGVDSLVFIDWIYDRPRASDDAIPTATGVYLNIPVISLTEAPTDLVHTGGNFMSDGQSKGFSSRLIVEENGPNNSYGISNHSEENVQGIMNDFMGIEEYLLMTTLPFDVINHIDMHMKIVNEQTILVGAYPEGVADGPQIEANMMFLIDEIQSAYGRPFELVRLPMPPDEFGRYPDNGGFYRTYTNAIMLNSTVIVPVYEERYDTTALRIWRETLPGHNIVGIECNDIIPLSGAIHCITKEIGASDPIQIIHTPLLAMDEGQGYEIFAEINHRHALNEVWLHYSQDGVAYDSVQMTLFDGEWIADLPALVAGEVIYFIRATSSIGKVIDKPLMGGRGGGYRVEVQPFVHQENVANDNHPVISAAFPNPASAMVMIPIDVHQASHVKADLFDRNGRRVRQVYHGTYEAYRHGVYIDASTLSAGSYILSIQVNDMNVEQQVIQVVR